MRLQVDSQSARCGAFPPTRWSMVVDCARQGSQSGLADAAMTQLFQDYWPPLYAFVRRRGFASQDAQDLVQGFFVHLIESGAYASVDRAKGKFRSFLLVSLKHYLSDDWDRRRCAKRGHGQPLLWIDEELDAIDARWTHVSPGQVARTEESTFERQWAFAVVHRALDKLEDSFADGGRRERIFRELKPFLTGGAALPGRADIAARLGITEEGLRSDLSRLRARYRECLQAEVERTVPSDTDPEEELSYLCKVLLAAG